MTMNIKNPEAHRLAKELADELGVSITEAVMTAIREKLHRVTGDLSDSRFREISRLLDDISSRIPPDQRHLDHADLLYDERGLPK